MRKLPQALQHPPPTIRHEPARETTLRLRAITPVLGGGVDSFVPDVIDGVRVPSIRGALRWWWRALQPNLNTAELRTLECEVWGGVGKDANETACASRVRIEVANVRAGKTESAGWHRWQIPRDPEKPPKHQAQATWGEGTKEERAYGYGAFPLQLDKQELKECDKGIHAPTGDWRRELEFEMRIRTDLAEDQRQMVHKAIKVWLVFGGYGARTRRGFGALHAHDATLDEVLEILEGLPTKDVTDRPTLAGCTVLRGGPQSSAQKAHLHLLEMLSTFRQGQNVGREYRGPDPKRSHWPEPDSMRKLSGITFKKHKPIAKAHSAPRAEFGLPLIVKFKGNGEDEFANGKIGALSAEGRFASPVLMRPVFDKGKWLPMILILHGHRPSKIVAANDGNKNTHTFPIVYAHAEHGGARPPISEYLQRAHGHAVDAFASWLTKEKGFKDVLGGDQ